MPAVPDLHHTDLDDRSDLERAIDDLLDRPLPDDWDDPAAIERRRGRLTEAACQAATATMEMLVLASAARSEQLAGEGPTVDAFAAALAGLHTAIRVYRRDTRTQDTLEVARRAMTGEAGGGIAELVVRLLERLWASLR